MIPGWESWRRTTALFAEEPSNWGRISEKPRHRQDWSGPARDCVFFVILHNLFTPLKFTYGQNQFEVGSIYAGTRLAQER